MEIMFFISGGVAVIASVMVITRYNAVHALLYLVVSLLAISIVFFLLGAPFAGALVVIIYAGAIMMLFIFVIMMLNLGSESARSEKLLLGVDVWLGPLLLGLVLAAQFAWIIIRGGGVPIQSPVISAKSVGVSLFSKYLLGVELAGLLLLSGIIGAYHLGRTGRAVYHRFLREEDK